VLVFAARDMLADDALTDLLQDLGRPAKAHTLSPFHG
jgi:hypothetical protein